jgi:gentisate 1,2-dioxygenase
VEGQRQEEKAGRGDEVYAHGGVVPTAYFERGREAYPMLRYPWKDTRAALMALAHSQPDQACVQVTYVNPNTGRDVQNNLGYYALMLRPGQTLTLPARSPSQVFHAVEGRIDVTVNQSRFALFEADTCCTPGYEAVTLGNQSTTEPAFLFIADESPLHRKLGVYEVRN